MKFSNKVDWGIERERCALLIHDMQQHYLQALPPDEREQLTANIRRIGRACVQHGVPIFATQVPAGLDSRERGLMLDMWGKGPSPDGHAIAPELGLAEHNVRLLTKRSYSAFYGNDFDVLLRRLRRDTIIVVGVYTSIGCYCSAVDAFMRDIRAFLVADAMADLHPADHEAGIAMAARTCARVTDTGNLCDALAKRKPEWVGQSGRIDVC